MTSSMRGSSKAGAEFCAGDATSRVDSTSTPGAGRAVTDDFDLQAYRRALGCFATGVAIVTATALDGRAIGLTISSFNSVSLDPPLILFSLAKSALSLEAMQRAEGYAINILGADQRGLSDRFARSLYDKWASVEHVIGHARAPLLAGAIAHFECAPWAQHDGGDHLIFVARVLRFSDARGGPLVFFQGAYRVLADDIRPPAWPLPIHY